MHPNPILPVLHALDPTHPWPDTLDPTFVSTLAASAARFLHDTRQLVTAGTDDTAAGTVASGDPTNPTTEILIMRLVSAAAHDARRIMRNTHLRTTDDTATAMLDVLTAALALRAAENMLGHSDERHGRSVVNRALAAAEWVGAAHHQDAVTFSTAALMFTDQLPPGWRWETRPRTDRDNDLRLFTVTRSRGGTYERVTVTCQGEEQVRIIHERVGRRRDETALTWPEVCQYMARVCATRPDRSGPSPSDTTAV